MKEKLKPKVKEIIDNWYKDYEYEVVHFWEKDDTSFVIVKYYKKTNKFEVKLDFDRIFPDAILKGDEYHISIDKSIILWSE